LCCCTHGGQTTERARRTRLAQFNKLNQEAQFNKLNQQTQPILTPSAAPPAQPNSTPRTPRTFGVLGVLGILRDVVEIVLAMSGIILRRLTVLRVASILASLAVYQFYLLPRATLELALWYFGFATLIHYVLLFGIFARTNNNWAKRLITRFGEERGFLIYEALMAFVFCHNGLSVGLLCADALRAGLDFMPQWALWTLGLSFSAIGFPVKIWATRVVGLDTYYYKDLFLRRPVAEFKVAGPYKVLDNPMYGVGHLHGYGVAIVSGSLVGLCAVALNQLCIWTFYLLIEKPHVREVYGAGAAE
jgi:protein-S-isoprenylcysteine O-methyltransferase Ste14